MPVACYWFTLFGLPPSKLLCFACFSWGLAAPPVLVTIYLVFRSSTPQPRGGVIRWDCRIAVDGHLVLQETATKLRRVPLRVSGETLYGERLLTSPDEKNDRIVLRKYQKAEGKVRVDRELQLANLPRDKRLLAVRRRDQRATYHSTADSLTRDEIELLDVPGNTVLLPDLVAARELAIGESYRVDRKLVAALFCIDEVVEGELSVTLEKCTEQTADLALKGNFKGLVDGSDTSLQVTGRIKLQRFQKMITALDLAIREQRDPGHGGPGLDVTAQLRLTAHLADSTELSDELAAGLELDQLTEAEVVEYRQPFGKFAFLCDRNWDLLIEQHDGSVLRLVRRGELVAQCNASPLRDAPAGKQLSLGAFRRQVTGSVADRQGQLVDASVASTEGGMRILRVVAVGQVDGESVQWNYYHFTGPQGRQASLVFTFESKVVEQFADADETIVSSFRFLRSPERGPVTRRSAASTTETR